MRAFDEDMAASSSSVSSKPKRERDSPSKKALLGTEVRILSLRKGAFLLSSMGVPGAIFYRGVRKMESSRLFAACPILFFGAWCWGGRPENLLIVLEPVTNKKSQGHFFFFCILAF